MLKPDELPDDIAVLKAMLIASNVREADKDTVVAQHEAIIVAKDAALADKDDLIARKEDRIA